MGKIHKAFLAAPTAAQFLDMKTSAFEALVAAGSLPKPKKFDRWDAEEITAIMRGQTPKPRSEFEL